MRRLTLVTVTVAAAVFVRAGSVSSQPAPGASTMPSSARLLLAAPSAVRGSGGVTIRYQLLSELPQVAIEVLNQRDVVVRRLSSAGWASPRLETSAGSHETTWDLRLDGAAVLLTPGDELPQYEPGPMAPPGTYRIRLVHGGSVVQTATLTIRRGPGTTSTPADLEVQAMLAHQVLQGLDGVTRTTVDLRALKRQVAERLKSARSPVIGLASDVVLRKLTEVEGALVALSRGAMPGVAAQEPLSPRLLTLARNVIAQAGKPTTEQAESARSLEGLLNDELERLAGVLANEVKAFDSLLANAMMEPLDIPEFLKPSMDGRASGPR